jgi:hypothetical protein
MKVIFSTQAMENYGTEESPRWKGKGGDEYVVANPTLQDVVNMNNAGTWIDYIRALTKAFESEHSCGNEYYEYILGWSLEEDNYKSEFERNQLKYEGKISFPMRDISGTLARIIKSRKESKAA